MRNKYGALLKGLVRCGSCNVGMTHTYVRKGSSNVYRLLRVRQRASTGVESMCCPVGIGGVAGRDGDPAVAGHRPGSADVGGVGAACAAAGDGNNSGVTPGAESTDGRIGRLNEEIARVAGGNLEMELKARELKELHEQAARVGGTAAGGRAGSRRRAQ